ncbi:MAG: putative selenium-dependent hydroxylase accessory protein YqeC [Oscillospiraceae bacterium]|nr:putative selenium-dependent hydroxylase accessory protein YqeC [Oscillospiraceae bacterium]
MAEFAKELNIRPGVTAIIGGGGKTTLLYRLAWELSNGHSVIVATSTHVFPPEDIPCVLRTGRVNGVLCVGTPCENGKLTAPEQPFEELAQLADYVLVEADGAARRPLKAHDMHEPVIPKNANQVICVVGASGIGKPVEEVVHRPALFTALSGQSLATPEAVAAVLTKEALHDRVLINQADTPQRVAAAKELAALMTCPVTIASLQKGEILCSY